MSRPFTDITVVDNTKQIKNQTIVCGASPTGRYQTYDLYVKNTPTINDIYNEYGNRFYNGIFVRLVNDQTVVGG